MAASFPSFSKIFYRGTNLGTFDRAAKELILTNLSGLERLLSLRSGERLSFRSANLRTMGVAHRSISYRTFREQLKDLGTFTIKVEGVLDDADYRRFERFSLRKRRSCDSIY